MENNAKKCKKCKQKWQKNDSRAGKMTTFWFSRSAPGLATRAGGENDKKMRKKMTKNAKPNDKKMPEKRQK